MRDILKAFGHFYIYSSVHIAICAGLLSIESYVVLGLPIDLNVVLFITFATMAVYSLHRLVGMSKVKAFENEGRYKLIKKYKHHILIYFIFSGMATAYYFFHLTLQQIIWLLFPTLLTLAYVLPVLKSGRRLRDLPFIKIFLIAIVWTWLSLVLPSSFQKSNLLILLVVERILFFVAITIPFDIRDKEVDASIHVKTLVHQLGIKKSKILAQSLLLLGFSTILFMLAQNLISLPICLGLSVCYLMSFVLIQWADDQKDDWYFGGMLDGTIGLRLIFILLSLKFITI